MDENKNINMDNEQNEQGDINRANSISEPDENGIRYYTVSDKSAYKESYNDDSVGNIDAHNSKTKKKVLGIPKGIFVFAVVVIALVLLSFIFSSPFGGNNSDKTALDLPGTEYIAMLSVEGSIQEGNVDYLGNPTGYQHQWTLDTIDELMVDENNKGLFIFVNSPGGGIYESDHLYLKLMEYKETTGRPVYSYMGNMAASGGYYISAACDRIIADRNCWTGSIGVTVGSFMDFSGLLEEFGVEVVTIDSGEFKAMGSSYREMSEEEKAIWQGLVDEAYLQFVEIVAYSRGYDLEEAKKIADGRIYSANQAVEIGLIDDIGSLDYAVEDMKVNYNLEGCEFTELAPTYDSGILSLIAAAATASKNESMSDLEIIMDIAGKTNQFPVSYTCEALLRY